MKFFQILLGLGVVLLLSSPVKAMEDQSGVVLSFDDTFVDQWHDYFSQNSVSDVRVTFFVSHWHTLSADQINKLKSLQAAGHEIANHTYSHKGLGRDYNFDSARVDEYLNAEIIPSLRNMRADGFEPVSFSYPYGERNEVYDAAIQQYFPYLRTTFADENNQLFQMDAIFHSASKNYSVLAGDGIDNSYNNSVAEIDGAFLRAKTNNEIVTFYAHRIIPDDSSEANHRFGIRVSHLDQIIAKAREMGLKFYTFREAYEVGNPSSDPLPTAEDTPPPPVDTPPATAGVIQVALEENRIRLQWSDLANDFIGIVPAGQPQWIEGMEGATTDGSASGKIGISIPASNTDQQYIAIFYNRGAEAGRSSAFTVAGTVSVDNVMTPTPTPTSEPIPEPTAAPAPVPQTTSTPIPVLDEEDSRDAGGGGGTDIVWLLSVLLYAVFRRSCLAPMLKSECC